MISGSRRTKLCKKIGVVSRKKTANDPFEVEKNPKSDEGFYLLGYIQGEQGDIQDMLAMFVYFRE